MQATKTLRLPGIILNHKLATILIVGIITRIVLMPISAHPFDINIWFNMSANVINHGPLSVELFPPHNGYYMIIPVAYAYDWLSHLFSTGPINMDSLPAALNFYPNQGANYVPGFLFNILWKIPNVISDIIIAVLIYKIIDGRMGKKYAEKATFLWFLNPFVIWISSAWGQWDGVAVMFSLMSFFLLTKNRFLLSSISLFLGVATKIFPALFLLPVLFFFIKAKTLPNRLRNFFIFSFPFIIGSAVTFLLSSDAIVNFFLYFFAPSLDFPVDSLTRPLAFGLTYWSTFLSSRMFELPLIREPIILFSDIILITAFVIAVWKVNKKSFKDASFDLASSMLFFIFALFLSFRLVLEQWFIWAIPFLCIISVGNKLKEYLYWGISSIALIYGILNCPFPFFFLPLAPWIENGLLSAVNFMLSAEPLRLFALIFLGCLFSCLLILFLKSDKIKCSHLTG